MNTRRVLCMASGRGQCPVITRLGVIVRRVGERIFPEQWPPSVVRSPENDRCTVPFRTNEDGPRTRYFFPVLPVPGHRVCHMARFVVTGGYREVYRVFPGLNYMFTESFDRNSGTWRRSSHVLNDGICRPPILTRPTDGSGDIRFIRLNFRS